MNVVLVGAREREINDLDRAEVDTLVRALATEHGTRLVIISAGCDKGISKYCLQVCERLAVKFMEVRVKFTGEGFSREHFIQAFLARNEALLRLGDLFYIFSGGNPRGIIESLIDPAKEMVGPQRVFTYNPRPRQG